MKRLGGLMLAFGAVLGLAVSVYNYVMPVGFLSPLSSTDGTLGALVPIGSTVLLLIAGLVLASGTRSRGLIVFFGVGSFLDILGTAFAGMLLDSTPLLVAMAIAALGWLLWVFGPRSAPAALRA
jgi:hypothetical protein